nr:acylphosphatase [uncultured Methanospirillum sp.]
MNTQQPKRWNILVCGTVQRVGYHHLIQGIARRNHITGCILNLKEYDVLIIAEGIPEDLERFKNDIRIQEYPVFVETLEISELPHTGEYKYFEIVRGTPDEELAERFDSAIAVLCRMEKKQDTAIDLGKETLDEVKGIRHDLDKTLTSEIAEVKEELREIRSALIQAGIMNSARS